MPRCCDGFKSRVRGLAGPIAAAWVRNCTFPVAAQVCTFHIRVPALRLSAEESTSYRPKLHFSDLAFCILSMTT